MKMILAQDNRSVNAVAKLGLTPLIVAAGSKQWRIVQILAASGADIALTDASDRSAYDIAVEEKAPESILQLLISVPDKRPKRNQPTPFSSIVVNDSVTVDLRGNDDV